MLVFFLPNDKPVKITEVISPTEFIINGNPHKIKDFETFDNYFSKRNQDLAKRLEISEIEAFILGNLAKNWARDYMQGRTVTIKDDDLVFLKFSYKIKFLYSGFCLKDGKPFAKPLFELKINEIKNNKFFILDLDTETYYEISDPKIRELKNFIVIKKYQKINTEENKHKLETKLNLENIKILFSDHTTQLKPSNKCESDICKEILTNINKAQKTIDFAIYGYSDIPEIEKSIREALSRGVKIRMIYDINPNGQNTYPNTPKLADIIKQSVSDKDSKESMRLMHNKFFIFDNKTIITGSANLSYTDMSGFNSNSIIVIKSDKIAEVYKKEFEQMYNGTFHSDKKTFTKNTFKSDKTAINIYFSPQDKTIENAILPLIEKAEKYIYIPTFVITEGRVVTALLNAQKRGVDIKIIIDALSASGQYSKHQTLRNSSIPVKTENYAGKMHSKSMIIDDKYTIIGSMNFSKNGDKRNDENLVVIEDEDIAKFYKNFFIYQWNKINNKWLKYNARAESKDSIGSCEDGIDNNYDGLTDSEDLACK